MFETVHIKEVKREIGKTVRALRKSKKLTQIDVAESLEVSSKTIQNLELGRNFTIDTLLKVLKELDALDKLYKEVSSQKRDIIETKPLY